MLDEMDVRKALVEAVGNRLEEAGIAETNVPTGLIYHYTTPLGLDGIIKTNQIYATHTDYLNDLSEIQYGRQIVVEIIRERLSLMDKYIRPMIWVPYKQPTKFF